MVLKRKDVIELVTNIDNNGFGIKRTIDIRNINIKFYNMIWDEIGNNEPITELLSIGCEYINDNKWCIPADNIDLDTVLVELQNEYENPYIIVILDLNNTNPDDLYMEWNVIIDFNLDVDKYSNYEI